MKKARVVNMAVTVCAILFCGVLANTPIEAKTNVIDVKYASYNVNFSMAANLKGFTGKKVCLHLKSSEKIAGLLKEVGNHLVHIEKLGGKDYFDALVRIDDISAIDARFRGVKR